MDTFKQHFVPFMKSHVMRIHSVTGPDLVKTLTKVKPSSSGLDAWKPESLVALGQMFPQHF